MDRGEKILQIFESSACLKPDQLNGYLEGTLFREELRVVELHLASCPLCQEALEGMETVNNSKALIASLTPPDLTANKSATENLAESTNAARQPFSHITKKPAPPSIPKSTFNATPNKYLNRPKNLSWLGIVGIAALLLFGGFLFWQYESNISDWSSFSFFDKEMANEILTDSNEIRQDDTQAMATKQKETIETKEEATNLIAQHDAETIADSNVSANAIPADSSKVISLIAAANIPIPEASVADSKATDKNPSQKEKEQQEKKEKTIAGIAPKKVEGEKNKAIEAAAISTITTSSETKEAAPQKNSDYNTGFQLYQKKQYASALLYLRSAAENDQDPNHWQAVYYTGLCNIEIGKKGRGKRLLKRVAKAGVALSSEAEQQLEKLETSE